MPTQKTKYRRNLAIFPFLDFWRWKLSKITSFPPKNYFSFWRNFARKNRKAARGGRVACWGEDDVLCFGIWQRTCRNGILAMPRGDRATIPAVNRRLHNSDRTRRRREERRVERRRQHARWVFSCQGSLRSSLSLSLSLFFSKSYRFHPL